MNTPTPLEQLMRVAVTPRNISIGLPASMSPSERRFPMTPEAAAMLVERGYNVRMESGAADSIHYADEAYSRRGVEIVTRRQALAADMVVYLPAITDADVRDLKRGALLLSFEHISRRTPASLKMLLEKSITTIAIDNIRDAAGNRPFADILHEIDGRAAVAIAASLLADAIHGKGILLGGVAGIVPCEVMLVGADIAAVAAARSVLGLGAIVRLFDNDIYRLRDIANSIGQGVITSAMHPKVVMSALKSADVVICCTPQRNFKVDSDMVAEMKRGVITFDISQAGTDIFPSMSTIDLAVASPGDNPLDGRRRVCYINAGNAVPRTAAMALSNTLLTMFDNIAACDSVANALKVSPGLSCAAMTFMGKPVNPEVAKALGVRPVDINLLLQFS